MPKALVRRVLEEPIEMRSSSMWSGMRPWPPEALPPGFELRLAALLNRVVEQVDSDGAVRSPCRSRVLESALAVRLFRRVDPQSRHLRRVVDYLRDARSTASPWDALTIDLALDGPAEVPSSVWDDLLARSPDFTGSRKLAFLNAYLALCGAAPQTPELAATGTLDGLHCWAAVQVTSTKVVLATESGRSDLVNDEDVRILLGTQGQDGVWEGNVLLHLWALHALDRLPGTADVVRSGVRALLVCQRPDGGFPFVTDTDTWCTATAGVALATAGAPSSVLARMASHLLERQQPAGGWSYTDRSTQTDVDDTSVAVQFLHTLDPVAYAVPIARGIRSLYAVRGHDSGFPTYISGAPSEACMTAAVLDALTTDWCRHEDAIVSGLVYLAGNQFPDGHFAPDWSASRFHTVFRVLLACDRNPEHQPPHVVDMVAKALDLVRAHQNPDGGWGQQDGDASDPISTSYAIIALCGQDDSEPVSRGLEYLLSHQRPDGGISSVSDSIGPRPFIFTVPALADIFPLLALGHVARRVEQTARDVTAVVPIHS
ncbi:hypothetical protein LFM09_44540 [Lentzea alba]|uniref:prenyltransferase/squalene oxidase repeat-containing protein n=1 Tax=Lentzea alba TaxID=2714351 RepID=UPI0039BF663D